MDSQEKDTTSLLTQYKRLIEDIKNFKGAESYIIDTIHRVSNLPVDMNYEVGTIYEVSRLLTKLAFNII